jgi:hypothetical protein
MSFGPPDLPRQFRLPGQFRIPCWISTRLVVATIHPKESPLMSSIDATCGVAVCRFVARSACATGVSLLLMLGVFPYAGGEASAQNTGLVDSQAHFRVGSLGVGLEAAQFDGLASDRLAYGPPAERGTRGRTASSPSRHDPDGRFAAGLPERREPRGFDPSSARPRVKPAPSAGPNASGPNVSGLSGIREPLPRLRESLPLLVQPMDERVGGAVPTGTVLPVGSGPNLSQPSLGRAFPPAPRPMVGPAVGVRPRPLTPPGR